VRGQGSGRHSDCVTRAGGSRSFIDDFHSILPGLEPPETSKTFGLHQVICVIYLPHRKNCAGFDCGGLLALLVLLSYFCLSSLG
jgi:hypothetical protein